MSRKAILLGSALAVGTFLTAAVAATASLSTAPQLSQSHQINRSNKGDRAEVNAAVQTPARVAVVEVVGVEDAAIVYRDRDGRVLFQTDPVSNVTVVTKNVVLPQLTIRETTVADVHKMPIEETGPVLSPTSPNPGCEPSVAPHTEPGTQRSASRCLSQAPTSGMVVVSSN